MFCDGVGKELLATCVCLADRTNGTRRIQWDPIEDSGFGGLGLSLFSVRSEQDGLATQTTVSIRRLITRRRLIRVTARILTGTRLRAMGAAFASPSTPGSIFIRSSLLPW